MVEIKVGRQTLKSERNSWVVVSHEQVRPECSYYSKLEQALNAMQDDFLRNGDAQSLEDLRRDLDFFRSKIAGLFAIEARYE